MQPFQFTRLSILIQAKMRSSAAATIALLQVRLEPCALASAQWARQREFPTVDLPGLALRSSKSGSEAAT